MKKLCFLLLISFVAFSCKKKEPEISTDTSINIDDPNEVAASIKIRNSTVKDGEIPVPSIEAGTPKISGVYGEDKLKGSGGETVDCNMVLEEGDVAGYFLQVDGSDTYFDIPASELRIGQTTETLTIPIELPSRIRAGEFCITYSVYSAERQVSNALSKCVEVSE